MSSVPLARPEAPAPPTPEPAALDVVRALLAAARFDEPTVARRLGGSDLFECAGRPDARARLGESIDDANAALIRLFLGGEPVSAERLAAVCGPDAERALRALGVVASDPVDPTRVRPTVLIVPLQGLWLASDLPPSGAKGPDPSRMPPDSVFPAITSLTRDFLEAIPDPSPDARVVELCAGTGVAALRAARRGAAEVWATDISPRSVVFERFNAALNGIVATCVESDGWSALGTETFDRVYAHPPYVPALVHQFDYRDGGADGEQVTRSIVSGLPAHLRPGGRCSLTCALSDRRGEPAEARLRAWLGAHAADFDVAVVERKDWDTMQAYRAATGGGADFVDCERWLRHFAAYRIERFALCTIEIRREARRPAPHGARTVRRRSSAAVDGAALDWLFRVEAWRTAAPTSEARLAGAAPRVVPGTCVDVRLRDDAQGEWRTEHTTVQTEYPARGAVRAPPAAATLLELCDGTRDVEALLAALRERALVDADVGVVEVARLVELLVVAGALAVPACPVPAAPLRPQRASGVTTAISSVPTQSTRQ